MSTKSTDIVCDFVSNIIVDGNGSNNDTATFINVLSEMLRKYQYVFDNKVAEKGLEKDGDATRISVFFSCKSGKNTLEFFQSI